jgi:hypothetical protein
MQKQKFLTSLSSSKLAVQFLNLPLRAKFLLSYLVVISLGAFVVNDWYISAYEPIMDIENNIIGILYVGMLEKPYIDLRNKSWLHLPESLFSVSSYFWL